MNLEEAILNELKKNRDKKEIKPQKSNKSAKKTLMFIAAVSAGYLTYHTCRGLFETEYPYLAVLTTILGLSTTGYAIRKFRDIQ